MKGARTSVHLCASLATVSLIILFEDASLTQGTGKGMMETCFGRSLCRGSEVVGIYAPTTFSATTSTRETTIHNLRESLLLRLSWTGPFLSNNGRVPRSFDPLPPPSRAQIINTPSNDQLDRGSSAPSRVARDRTSSLRIANLSSRRSFSRSNPFVLLGPPRRCARLRPSTATSTATWCSLVNVWDHVSLSLSLSLHVE